MVSSARKLPVGKKEKEQKGLQSHEGVGKTSLAGGGFSEGGGGALLSCFCADGLQEDCGGFAGIEVLEETVDAGFSETCELLVEVDKLADVGGRVAVCALLGGLEE